mmetsp:Transcript_31239/g.99634  ORF Transcript_31239/g.99634 Transcript_31239/m.99634 type:complete len:227 (+) Transcript_31239:734-1414(+)
MSTGTSVRTSSSLRGTRARCTAHTGGSAWRTTRPCTGTSRRGWSTSWSWPWAPRRRTWSCLGRCARGCRWFPSIPPGCWSCGRSSPQTAGRRTSRRPRCSRRSAWPWRRKRSGDSRRWRPGRWRRRSAGSGCPRRRRASSWSASASRRTTCCGWRGTTTRIASTTATGYSTRTSTTTRASTCRRPCCAGRGSFSRRSCRTTRRQSPGPSLTSRRPATPRRAWRGPR